MAAEIPPVPCRPPRLLDGRGDDGAGRRPTRWSETERGEDARLSAMIVFFLSPTPPSSDARMVEPLLTEPSDAHQRWGEAFRR